MEEKGLLEQVNLVEDAQKDHRDATQEVINNYNMGFITPNECSEQLLQTSIEYRDAVASFDLKAVYAIIEYKILKQIS